MDKAFGTGISPIPASKKVIARAALVDLKDPPKSILVDCFRQFGIETHAIASNAAERLKKEKFEACAIKLGPGRKR